MNHRIKHKGMITTNLFIQICGDHIIL